MTDVLSFGDIIIKVNTKSAKKTGPCIQTDKTLHYLYTLRIVNCYAFFIAIYKQFIGFSWIEILRETKSIHFEVLTICDLFEKRCPRGYNNLLFVDDTQMIDNNQLTIYDDKLNVIRYMITQSRLQF